jgi:hypothetical protein
MAVLRNQKNRSCIVHLTANAELVMVGNSSVSDIAIDDEEVKGASIKQAWFGSPSGALNYITVARGSNTVAVYDSTAWMDYAGNGALIDKDSTGTLVVTFTGSEPQYLMLELRKEFDDPNPSDPY